MPPATYKDLCIDAADPVRLGRFWGAVLGWELNEHDDGDADLRDGAGRVQLWLNRVPEPRTVKNRLHVDLQPTDRTRDEEVERLLGLGATLVEDHRQDGGTGWVWLADPEGNDFCVERSAEERGPRSVQHWHLTTK